MKALQKYFLLALLAGAVLAGCRPDDDTSECPCDDPSNPECPNYDPCFGKNPTSADFVIEQRWSQAPDSLRYVGGTDKLTKGTLRFSANEQDAWTYKWYLGEEVITEPTFERNFGAQVPFGTMITASLVLTKAPADQNCFPDDDGRDSIAKNFFIMNPCDFLVNNKFKGTYEHAPLDTVLIELLFDDPNSSECNASTFSAFNLGNSGMWDIGIQYPNVVYNQLYVAGGGGSSPKGFLSVDEETEIAVFNYRYYNVDWVFTGKIFHE